MVLVVDDEVGPRESVHVSVADRYNYHGAGSGEEAVEFIRKNTVDVVVLDLKMPGMSGIDVLKCIRVISPETRVIILTGYESQESARESARLGACDYLVKPFNVPELREAIDRAMSRRNSVSRSEVLRLFDSRPPQETSTPSVRPASLPDEFQGVLGSYLHDLKGEFVNLGAVVDRLRELLQDNPEAKTQCDHMQESITLAQVIVRRLLDYGRLTVSHRQSITVAALISRVESLARPRLPSTTQLVTSIKEICLERVLSIDPEQVVGVLLELIHNAVVASSREGGRIEIGVTMRRWPVLKSPQIKITVKDSGRGVPDEIRPSLFKRRLANVQGQGLGLFLANKAIQSLDGKVLLQSSSKNGSTFAVLLPIVLPPPLEKQNANKNSSSRR
jgi:DNA-binding NarL/FixJ family response regulator/anti-sigma regulatory factor (Ser/Thr protein kinase)